MQKVGTARASGVCEGPLCERWEQEPAATRGEAFSLRTSVPSGFGTSQEVIGLARLTLMASGFLVLPSPDRTRSRGPTSFHRCSGMALMSTGWRSITFRNRTSGTAMAQITWTHLGGEGASGVMGALYLLPAPCHLTLLALPLTIALLLAGQGLQDF